MLLPEWAQHVWKWTGTSYHSQRYHWLFFQNQLYVAHFPSRAAPPVLPRIYFSHCQLLIWILLTLFHRPDPLHSQVLFGIQFGSVGHVSVFFSHSHIYATAMCISTLFLPFLRPVPLGQQFVFQWPLGTQSLAAGGAGSLQPWHGCLPAPQAKRSIHHLAHREKQTSTCPRLYQHAATHHRVSTGFLLNMTPKMQTGWNA